MSRDLFFRRGWLLPLTLGLFVDNVRGTPFRAAALLAAFIWAAWVLRRAGRRPAFTPALTLFLFWCAAGVFFSSYRAGTLAELSLLLGAVSLWSGASVLWGLYPDEKKVFARALIVLGLVKGAAALLSPSAGGRILWDPGDVATANVALTPMFLASGVIAGRREGEPLWRGLWVLLLAATLWLCVRWNAMAALLGLALGVPLEAAFHRKSRIFFWVAAAGTVATLVLFFSSAAPAWLQYDPGNPARLERLVIWRDSLAYARAHLWTGTALGTFEQYYPQFKTLSGFKTANYAHNEWIQILCENGLPGALLAGFLLWRGLGLLRRRGRDHPGAAAGLTALTLWACVYFPFRSDPLIFAGAMMIACFSSESTVPLRRKEGVALLSAALLSVVVSSSQGAAQVLEKAGGAAWDAGDAGKALGRFHLAARLDPLEPRLLLHQVECLRKLDRKAETLPLLERALALKPRDVWVRRTLAVARLNLVGPEAARETYAPILSLAPNVARFRREYEELAPAKR